MRDLFCILSSFTLLTTFAKEQERTATVFTHLGPWWRKDWWLQALLTQSQSCSWSSQETSCPDGKDSFGTRELGVSGRTWFLLIEFRSTTHHSKWRIAPEGDWERPGSSRKGLCTSHMFGQDSLFCLQPCLNLCLRLRRMFARVVLLSSIFVEMSFGDLLERAVVLHAAFLTTSSIPGFASASTTCSVMPQEARICSEYPTMLFQSTKCTTCIRTHLNSSRKHVCLCNSCALLLSNVIKRAFADPDILQAESAMDCRAEAEKAVDLSTSRWSDDQLACCTFALLELLSCCPGWLGILPVQWYMAALAADLRLKENQSGC